MTAFNNDGVAKVPSSDAVAFSSSQPKEADRPIIQAVKILDEVRDASWDQLPTLRLRCEQLKDPLGILPTTMVGLRALRLREEARASVSEIDRLVDDMHAAVMDESFSQVYGRHLNDVTEAYYSFLESNVNHIDGPDLPAIVATLDRLEPVKGELVQRRNSLLSQFVKDNAFDLVQHEDRVAQTIKGITSPGLRYQAALALAKHEPHLLAALHSVFCITDANQRFELLKLCGQSGKYSSFLRFALGLERGFEVGDPSKVLELAGLLLKTHFNAHYLRWPEILNPLDEELRVGIVKLMARYHSGLLTGLHERRLSTGERVCLYLWEEVGIEDPELLQELAFESADNPRCASGLKRLIECFKIKDNGVIFSMAERWAKHHPFDFVLPDNNPLPEHLGEAELDRLRPVCCAAALQKAAEELVEEEGTAPFKLSKSDFDRLAPILMRCGHQAHLEEQLFILLLHYGESARKLPGDTKLTPPEKLGKREWKGLTHLCYEHFIRIGVPLEFIKHFRKSVERSRFNDFRKHQALIKYLVDLIRLSRQGEAKVILSAKDVQACLECISGPMKQTKSVGKRLAKLEKKPTVAELIERLRIFDVLVRLERIDLLLAKSMTPFQRLEKVLGDALPELNLENFEERYREYVKGKRYPLSLLIGMAGLTKLAEEEPETVKAAGELLETVLGPDFQRKRYALDRQPQLAALFESPKDPVFEEWRRGAQMAVADLDAKEEPSRTVDMTQWLRVKLCEDNHIKGLELNQLKEFLCAEDKGVREQAEKALESQPESEEKKLQQAFISLAKATDLSGVLEQAALLRRFKLLKGEEVLNDLKSSSLQGLFPQSIDRSVLVIDTGDSYELARCGSDVPDSCQRLDGAPELYKGVEGYILNGCTRLLEVKKSASPSAPILARCMLRLVSIEENGKLQPALYIEDVYGDVSYESVLRAAALKRAEALGKVPLFESTRQVFSSEGNVEFVVSSKGGPSLWEYIDLAGGNQTHGAFASANVKLVK